MGAMQCHSITLETDKLGEDIEKKSKNETLIGAKFGSSDSASSRANNWPAGGLRLQEMGL
jgi:hypothetical protein